MTKREWMRNEIAEWRSEGVIGDDLAGKLLARYAERESKISWGAMLAGGFGALMIGLGVIALFAANWDCFGRGERAAISVAPMLVCGIVALVAAKRGVKSMSLWEPLGILWTIATGAAACLVAQTYQVGGSVPGLILFVALLTLPIAWVTRSVMVTALWPVFGIAWAISYEDANGESSSLVFKALALMALSVPGYIAFLRREQSRAALITGQLITGFVYSLGTAVMICNAMPYVDWSVRGETFIGVFWVCALLVGSVGVIGKLPAWPMIATLVATGAAMPTTFEATELFCVAIVLAVVITAVGIRKVRLTYTNIGAALFFWLVISKFFESDVDFTVKGIVLIVAGVALTALNAVMIKFKKRRAVK